MAHEMAIPEVNNGDLVLVRKGQFKPFLFVSDGRVARLDDIGYPPEKTETLEGIEHTGPACGIYRLAPPKGHGCDYTEGVRLFKEELIAAGNYEDYLSVFSPGDERDMWVSVFSCSPGIALGYDPSQGLLQLAGDGKHSFKFRGQEYEYGWPSAGNQRRTTMGDPNIPSTILPISNDDLGTLVVGQDAVRQELTKDPQYKLFVAAVLTPES